ncbi:MAG: 6,7-dimethyl-8-ribityllumazine synthase [Mycobacteriaceae bacterium]
MSTADAPSTDKRIAFVAASWHKQIVDRARDAFLEEIAACGYPSNQVDIYDVPGAFEIPLYAKKLADTGRYCAIVGAALVADGGIYRHEFVASAVIDGLMRVQLDTEIPVISVVLTPHHFHEHPEHSSYFDRHFAIKGAEAARTCSATIEALKLVSDR